MENLIERIKKQSAFDDIKATKKLNLIYVKLRAAGITTFVDEYIDWLMSNKDLNFKKILKTPDSDLYQIYLNEYKK